MATNSCWPVAGKSMGCLGGGRQYVAWSTFDRPSRLGRRLSPFEASNTPGEACNTFFVHGCVQLSRGDEPGIALSTETILNPLLEWGCLQLICGRGSSIGRMKMWNPGLQP